MPSPTAITPSQLARLVGLPGAPRLIDLRPEADTRADPRVLPAARRLDAGEIAHWSRSCAGVRCVVYCGDGGAVSQGAAAWLRGSGIEAETLEGGFAAWRAADLPLLRIEHLPAPDASGATLWVTRARPKVVRIACPWLIRRFVDPDARFLFVPPHEVAAVAGQFGATPFDAGLGRWDDHGELCTFDAMLDGFGLRTAPLVHLARIVRGADTGLPDLAPEAPGLLAASLGYSRMHRDDMAQLAATMGLYDALYRWCRDATGETHG